MTFDDLRALAELHCQAVLDLPGEVYFGSLEALSAPNGLAIIGLNPGGEGLPPIRQHLARYRQEVKPDFSGYLDQCWHDPEFSKNAVCTKCQKSLAKSGKVHQQRHQKTVEKIANVLGVNLRRTLALNAIWIQTPSADALRRRLSELQLPRMDQLFQQQFFPAIDALLSRCETRFVLCLGNGASESAFSFFRVAHGVPPDQVMAVSDDYRDGRYFVHEAAGVRRIYFGIAHPSMHSVGVAGLARLLILFHESGLPTPGSTARFTPANP